MKKMWFDVYIGKTVKVSHHYIIKYTRQIGRGYARVLCVCMMWCDTGLRYSMNTAHTYRTQLQHSFIKAAVKRRCWGGLSALEICIFHERVFVFPATTKKSKTSLSAFFFFFSLRFPNFLTSAIFIRELAQLVDSSQGRFSPHAFVVSLIEELSEVLHWWCCTRGNCHYFCIFWRPSQFSSCSLEHWLVLPLGRGSWRGHSILCFEMQCPVPLGICVLYLFTGKTVWSVTELNGHAVWLYNWVCLLPIGESVFLTLPLCIMIMHKNRTVCKVNKIIK